MYDKKEIECMLSEKLYEDVKKIMDNVSPNVSPFNISGIDYNFFASELREALRNSIKAYKTLNRTLEESEEQESC